MSKTIRLTPIKVRKDDGTFKTIDAIGGSGGGSGEGSTNKQLLQYDGTSIKDPDGNVLTHDAVYNMLMESPDFVVLVYEDRAYHPNFVSNEQIIFSATLVSDGFIQTNRITLLDSDEVTVTYGKAEAVVNKTNVINDTNKDSTGKYPSIKAVSDFVEAKIATVDAAVNAKVDAVSDEVDVERQRIDQIARLEDGSTTGDAELADIRVGANGVTYDNAGAAVRGQYNELKEDLSQLETAVNGKYTKPESGVPETDLDAAVRQKLNSGGGGGGAFPEWNHVTIATEEDLTQIIVPLGDSVVNELYVEGEIITSANMELRVAVSDDLNISTVFYNSVVTKINITSQSKYFAAFSRSIAGKAWAARCNVNQWGITSARQTLTTISAGQFRQFCNTGNIVCQNEWGTAPIPAGAKLEVYWR